MSRGSFLCKGQGKSKGYLRSPVQEKELAKRSGGRRVSGSGSGPEKGDIKKYSGVFRIEAKTTAAASFRVTRKMIQTLEQTALSHEELPAIIIEFIDDKGRPVHEVAVVPVSVLESLNVSQYREAGNVTS